MAPMTPVIPTRGTCTVLASSSTNLDRARIHVSRFSTYNRAKQPKNGHLHCSPPLLHRLSSCAGTVAAKLDVHVPRTCLVHRCHHQYPTTCPTSSSLTVQSIQNHVQSSDSHPISKHPSNVCLSDYILTLVRNAATLSAASPQTFVIR
jgi:hypothetical protein